VFVTVPESPVVTTFPVTAGNVIVFVPAVPVALTTIVPDVEPLNVAPLEPIVGVVNVKPDIVEAVEPSETDVEPIVILEFVSPEFGIVATLEITPPDVVVTYPLVVSGKVTVPVNVGEAVVAIPVTDPEEPFTLSTPVFAIVTAPEPLYEVPERPVPIVSAFKLDPSDTPEIVELVKDVFEIFVRVFEDPEIVLFVRVCVSVKPTIADPGIVCPPTAVAERTVVPLIINVLPEVRFRFSDELNDPVEEYHLRVLLVVPLI
jgi:hypothetical protein